MIFNEKRIILKNGEVCTLKSPDITDAEKLLEYLRKTSYETNFMLRYPEEVTMTIEEEKKFINSIRENPNGIMISAFLGDRLVGNTSLNSVGNFIKTSHRANFGIAIVEDAWHLGIGRALITEILKFASNSGFEQVELEVVSINRNAINLYKQFGFEIYGKRDNGFKFKDGSYVTEFLMMKKLF